MVKDKKTSAKSDQGMPLQTAVRRARICFERIIPDKLDPEQNVRRALRGELIAAAGGAKKLNASEVAQVARMAVVTSKKWGPGFTVRCRCYAVANLGQLRIQAVTQQFVVFNDQQTGHGVSITKGIAGLMDKQGKVLTVDVNTLDFVERIEDFATIVGRIDLELNNLFSN